MQLCPPQLRVQTLMLTPLTGTCCCGISPTSRTRGAHRAPGAVGIVLPLHRQERAAAAHVVARAGRVKHCARCVVGRVRGRCVADHAAKAGACGSRAHVFRVQVSYAATANWPRRQAGARGGSASGVCWHTNKVEKPWDRCSRHKGCARCRAKVQPLCLCRNSLKADVPGTCSASSQPVKVKNP